MKKRPVIDNQDGKIHFRNAKGDVKSYSKEEVAEQLARYNQDNKPVTPADYHDFQKEVAKHGYFRVNMWI